MRSTEIVRFGIGGERGNHVRFDVEDKVEFAGQELGDLGLLVRNRRQQDALDGTGRAHVGHGVVVVLLVDHVALGGIEGDDPVGAGADRIAAEVTLVFERAIDLRRIDRNVYRQAVEERREQFLARDAHRQVVDLLDFVDPAEARVLEAEIVFRIHEHFERIGHVVGRSNVEPS